MTITEDIVLRGEQYDFTTQTWDSGSLVRVVLARPCLTCDGVGVVYNAVWDDFRQWHESQQPGHPDALEEQRWWESHGGRYVQTHHPPFGHVEPPPEEIPCVECEGSRYQLTPNGMALATLVRLVQGGNRG